MLFHLHEGDGIPAESVTVFTQSGASDEFSEKVVRACKKDANPTTYR